MTSLAFLFAVFLARRARSYLLDDVEARRWTTRT